MRADSDCGQLVMVADMFHAAKIEKEAHSPTLYLLRGVFLFLYAGFVFIFNLSEALLFLRVGGEYLWVTPIRQIGGLFAVFLFADVIDGSLSVAECFYLRFHHFHKFGGQSIHFASLRRERRVVGQGCR